MSEPYMVESKLWFGAAGDQPVTITGKAYEQEPGDVRTELLSVVVHILKSDRSGMLETDVLHLLSEGAKLDAHEALEKRYRSHMRIEAATAMFDFDSDHGPHGEAS